MIDAIALLATAFLLAGYGPRLLTAAAWTGHAPRLAVTAWLALLTAILSGVIFAGLATTVPMAPVSDGLAGTLQSCVMALRAAYATPGGALIASIGLVGAGAIASRAVWCMTMALRRARRHARTHTDTLTLVGRSDTALGAVVVASDEPSAYCLPGRTGRIVVTAGALRALDAEQLAAVLAHERAHQRGHHHLLLALAEAAGAAFPRVPAFAAARQEIPRLVELLADDAAASAHGRLTVAEAVLALASARTTTAPSAALAAAGSGAAARVRRMIAQPRPVPPAARLGGSLGAGLLALLPLLLLTAPALLAAQMAYCTSTQMLTGLAGTAAWLAHPLAACA
ncbi:M56 family metallopeptidase [Streptomyces caniferus]|uniref:M56 family metallopeptidase n=1 Tax=Streptomyces caniferus TaxID=285557 RepID=UPI002E2B85CB|nr:M56 family metallopeptidase [Streptomyces caniferus]